MNMKRKTKYIHEGKFVAEVEVKLIFDETGWAPYLTLEEAAKLDDLRDALRRGDVRAAAKTAKVYELHPVAV